MYFSNVSRGKRKKKNEDSLIPPILKPESSPKEYRKKLGPVDSRKYEIDPMTCSKCQRRMKIIGLIEDEEVIEKILKHLGPWNLDLKVRLPPNAKGPP